MSPLVGMQITLYNMQHLHLCSAKFVSVCLVFMLALANPSTNRFSCIYLTLTSKIRDRPTWTSQAALNCFFEIKLIFIFHGQLVRNEETWTDTTGKISENQESLLITKIDFRPVSISTLNPDNADIIHQDARCENGVKDNMYAEDDFKLWEFKVVKKAKRLQRKATFKIQKWQARISALLVLRWSGFVQRSHYILYIRITSMSSHLQFDSCTLTFLSRHLL